MNSRGTRALGIRTKQWRSVDAGESVVARWNSTEGYYSISGKWRIIHSYWSSIKPQWREEVCSFTKEEAGRIVAEAKI